LYIVERVVDERSLGGLMSLKNNITPEVLRVNHLGGGRCGRYWTRVRDFERQFYTGTVIDAVRIVRADIFVKIGGFDETLTGPEDWDLDKRVRQLGKVGVLDSRKGRIYHHEGRFSLSKYLQKKNYYVRNFDRYIKKWGKSDPDIKKQFNPYYRTARVFIEKGRWKKFIRHPGLAMGVYLLRFGVGIVYLTKQ
jgi:GT2 family glycosyltransferase